MKKILILGLMITMLLSGCQKENKEMTKIGISQIVEYSALDENRAGFIKALEDNGYKEGENLEIDYQNAQGDSATSQLIAQNFVSKDKDLIFAIATGCAQSAYNATKEIPIVFSSVTDPVAAGIVESLEASNTNVTGTTDIIPVEQQLKLVKLFKPETKKIGIIYNTSEVNSEIQVKALKQACIENGYEFVQRGVSATNEVQQAMASLADNIDLLFVPTDQLVVSSLPVIVDVANKNDIPIIASEKGSVENGALGTYGIDYNRLGYLAGEKAVAILKGEKPKDIKVDGLDQYELVINVKQAELLNINIPEELEYTKQ